MNRSDGLLKVAIPFAATTNLPTSEHLPGCLFFLVEKQTNRVKRFGNLLFYLHNKPVSSVFFLKLKTPTPLSKSGSGAG